MTQGVEDRLIVVDADLGRMEWPGTKELAARQAAHYGARVVGECACYHVRSARTAKKTRQDRPGRKKSQGVRVHYPRKWRCKPVSNEPVRMLLFAVKVRTENGVLNRYVLAINEQKAMEITLAAMGLTSTETVLDVEIREAIQ